MIPTLEIDIDGNIQTLYNDDINLYDLGKVCNVKRASHINFNEQQQRWQVVCATTGKIVFSHHNRAQAIRWEIENFSPDGKYYAI